jgi:hypothetical protein
MSFRTTNVNKQPSNLAGGNLCNAVDLNVLRTVRGVMNIPASYGENSPIFVYDDQGKPITLGTNECVISVGLKPSVELSGAGVYGLFSRYSGALTNNVVVPVSDGTQQSLGSSFDINIGTQGYIASLLPCTISILSSTIYLGFSVTGGTLSSGASTVNVTLLIMDI